MQLFSIILNDWGSQLRLFYIKDFQMQFNKNLFIYFGLILGIFGFQSCSNDFVLTEGNVELPVVYGLISSSSDVNYIRVERTFIDEQTSAFVLAKDSSKLYFPNLSVRLKNLATNQEITLKRVDGNKEGLQRSPGVFATAPNYLYKFTSQDMIIQGNVQYKLTLIKDDGSILAEATTTAITKYTVDDVSAPPASGLVAFQYNTDFKVRWFGDVNALIHDVNFIMNIKEDSSGTVKNKTLVWPMVRNTDKFELNIRGRGFYEFMSSNLTANTRIKRSFNDLSIQIISGSKEVRDYISIGQANLGITSSGEIPTYSNISNDGLGIFGSRTDIIRKNLILTPPTLDSLRNGFITKNLNF